MVQQFVGRSLLRFVERFELEQLPAAVDPAVPMDRLSLSLSGNSSMYIWSLVHKHQRTMIHDNIGTECAGGSGCHPGVEISRTNCR